MALQTLDTERRKKPDLRKSETRTTNPQPPVYAKDYYGWLLHQIECLRLGRLPSIDATNIAEELEDMGKSEYDRLTVFLKLIVLHMLKWDYQPDRRSQSWISSIRIHRRHFLKYLQRSPSLKPLQEQALQEAYMDAQDEASAETGLALEAFPETCPYSWDEIIERVFEIEE
jgi:hypothetical protein